MARGRKNAELSEAVRGDLERASVRDEITKKMLARRIAPKTNFSAAHVQNMLSGYSLRDSRAGLRILLQAITEEMRLVFKEAGLTVEPTDYVARFLDEQPPLFEDAAGTRERREIFAGGKRVLTRATFQSASMDEWQSAFWDVYGVQDDYLKLHDMMLQLTVDATRLSEAIRKDDYVEALSYLPRVMSWVFSLSSKTAAEFDDLSPDGALLSNVVWAKYPGLCSLCAEPRCICFTWVTDDLSEGERADKERANAAKLDRARRMGTRPVTLNEWVGMFEDIYGRVNRSRGASDKMLHLWEEIGELEVELRNADRIDAGETENVKPIEWESELADVFSWVSSVYLHISGYHRRARAFSEALERRASMDGMVTNFPEPRTLAHWLWLEFRGDPIHGGLRCHKCGDSECGCSLDYPRR